MKFLKLKEDRLVGYKGKFYGMGDIIPVEDGEVRLFSGFHTEDVPEGVPQPFPVAPERKEKAPEKEALDPGKAPDEETLQEGPDEAAAALMDEAAALLAEEESKTSWAAKMRFVNQHKESGSPAIRARADLNAWLEAFVASGH